MKGDNLKQHFTQAKTPEKPKKLLLKYLIHI